MKLYQEIIEKLLEEVDSDIKEIMMKKEPIGGSEEYFYKGYQLLPDPANTILGWQAIRGKKKE